LCLSLCVEKRSLNHEDHEEHEVKIRNAENFFVIFMSFVVKGQIGYAFPPK